MKLIFFQGSEIVDRLTNRISFLRVPEVLKYIHRVESQFEFDLINLIQIDDVEFLRRPRLRFLYSLLVHRGLYERLEKKINHTYIVAKLGNKSVAEVVFGRQSFDELVEMLIEGMKRDQWILSAEEAKNLGENQVEWGVYEKIGPRVIQLPIGDPDRLKLTRAILSTRKIDQMIWVGILDKFDENLVFQKLGAEVTLTDSMGFDPKLGILKAVLMTAFEWA